MKGPYSSGRAGETSGTRPRSAVPCGPPPSWLGAVALVTLLLGGPGCGRQAPVAPDSPAEPVGPSWFTDVSDEVGLDFVHDAGPTGTYFLPQLLGSGAALLDCDGDGRLDILLLQN